MDSDGKVRYVLCDTDPSTVNWLDTAGRRNGLCTLRWFWPTGDRAMTPTAEVVALADLAAAIPMDHPTVTLPTRAARPGHPPIPPPAPLQDVTLLRSS